MILLSKKKAFTLVELVVGITIISILVLGATSIDFNRLNNKQRLDIFANKIKTTYETVRNNSLLGKGIGTNLIIPSKSTIEFSKTNSGTIVYKTYNISDTLLDSKTLLIPNNFEVSSIKCGEYNDISQATFKEINSSGTGIIEFKGINIKLDNSLNSDCNIKDRVLEITTSNKNEKKYITINTLNGLVHIK